VGEEFNFENVEIENDFLLAQLLYFIVSTVVSLTCAFGLLSNKYSILLLKNFYNNSK
jgi:hypothetical protein